MPAKVKLLIVMMLILAPVSYFGGAGRPSYSYAPDTRPTETRRPETARASPVAAPNATDTLLAQAFQQRRGNFQITGALPVSRVLPDDRDGSRHQKFILQTSTGQTVLVAHNIDIAPRIPGVQVGDTVEFYGEYEWNEKGGVIHWTHHDPAGRHAHGWLRHNGSLYQ